MSSLPPPTIDTLVQADDPNYISPDGGTFRRVLNDPKLLRMLKIRQFICKIPKYFEIAALIAFMAMLGGWIGKWGEWYSISWKILIVAIVLDIATVLGIYWYIKRFNKYRAKVVNDEIAAIINQIMTFLPGLEFEMRDNDESS